jgi:BarA-like signal transduction histidine kinase
MNKTLIFIFAAMTAAAAVVMDVQKQTPIGVVTPLTDEVEIISSDGFE